MIVPSFTLFLDSDRIFLQVTAEYGLSPFALVGVITEDAELSVSPPLAATLRLCLPSSVCTSPPPPALLVFFCFVLRPRKDQTVPDTESMVNTDNDSVVAFT